MDMTCLPTGASESSKSDGIEISRKGALEVIDSGADVDAACESGIRVARIFQCGERRKRIERDVQFRGGSAATVIPHLDHEAWRQMHGIEQAEQRALRIGPGNDCFRRDFFAARESDAGYLSMLH